MEQDKDTQLEEQPQDKHPGGRPLAFESVEALDSAINKYFALCDPHIEKQQREIAMDNHGNPVFGPVDVLTQQKPYTMSGLARALGVDRRTLLNYSNKEEFFPTIQAAKARCEEYAEGMLFSPYSNGAKFNLTNNYDDWHDKQELDHTSKGESIQPKIVSEIAPRATAQAEATPGDTASQQPAD